MRFLVIFIVSALVFGCSDQPVNTSMQEVEAEISDEQLQLHNNSVADIYYFVVEQDMAAKINWEPRSQDENRIQSGDTKLVSLSEVMEYEAGDTVIIYFWTSEDPESDQIKNILVE
ncbi:hypothetical protein [Fodinibius sp. Rm-B-1B1-1]|uniref:hypothetical protein n=1 Tax=Fodinibius alkaliphilus TaxID=3140241 RepID=UPI00315A83AF